MTSTLTEFLLTVVLATGPWDLGTFKTREACRDAAVAFSTPVVEGSLENAISHIACTPIEVVQWEGE